MRYILSAALLTVSLAGGAMAQTGTSGSANQATPAPDASKPGAMHTAQSTTAVTKFITVKPTDIMASRLDDTNIVNKQNETIGEIEDLVIEDGKTVTGVVVSVGGFLGLGERYVAINPSSLMISRDGDTVKVMTDMTKDELKNAPSFDYNKKD